MRSAQISKINISIIIPTWNSNAYLSICLNSLALQTFRNFEVVIVDNGSKGFDKSKTTEERSPMDIKVISLTENMGFAVACNLGAQVATGEWLAFLNADAYPEPDWLESFMAGQNEYPQAGCFGSMILRDSEPNLVDSAGDVCHMSGTAWKEFSGYPVSKVPVDSRRIFAPYAAAAFYNRNVFFEIGGFDEDFFSFYEDVDLGFRLNLYGYQCIFLPDTRVRHVGSSSTGKDSDFALYHSQRNFIWSYIKNMPGLLFWLYFPVHLLANLIFFLQYIKRGRAKVVFKAKADASKGLKKMLVKRRQIQHERRASVREINQLIDKHLLAPFLLGRNLRRYNKNNANPKK